MDRKGFAPLIILGIIAAGVVIGIFGYWALKKSENPQPNVASIDPRWIGYYRAYQFVNGNNQRRDYDMRIYDTADSNGNPEAQLDISDGASPDYDNNIVSSDTITVLPEVASGTLSIIFESASDPSVSYKKGDILFSLVPYTQYNATGTYSVAWGVLQPLPDTWDKGPILFDQPPLDRTIPAIPADLVRVGDQFGKFTVTAINKNQNGGISSIDYSGTTTITLSKGYDFESPTIINGKLCGYTDGLSGVKEDETNRAICISNNLPVATINTIYTDGALVTINGLHEVLGSADAQNTTQLADLIEPTYSLTPSKGGTTVTLTDATHGFSIVYPAMYGVQDGNSGNSDFYLGAPTSPFIDDNDEELLTIANQEEGVFVAVSIDNLTADQCKAFPDNINFGQPPGVTKSTINGSVFYSANGGDAGMSHDAEYGYYHAMGPHGCYGFNFGLDGGPDLDGNGGIQYSSQGPAEIQAMLNSIKLF